MTKSKIITPEPIEIKPIKKGDLVEGVATGNIYIVNSVNEKVVTVTLLVDGTTSSLGYQTDLLLSKVKPFIGSILLESK